MSANAVTSQASRTRLSSLILMAVASTGMAEIAAAQDRSQPLANWALSEKFSRDNLDQYVYSTTVRPSWINETDSLWYEWENRDGTRFYLVIPKSNAKQPLFDHVHMAEQLSTVLKKPVEPHRLPIEGLEFEEDGRTITFEADSTKLQFDLDAGTLEAVPEEEEEEDEEPNFRTFSPDSTAYVYALDHNLYYAEMDDEDNPIQLSTDGEEYYSFGSRNGNGFRGRNQENRRRGGDDEEEEEEEQRVRARVTWSEDSQAFFVTRSDSREVDELYLVNVLADPRPELRTYKYTMPGEENVTQYEFFTFNRADKQFRELDVSKWQDQRLFNIHWPEGSDRIRMVRRDRPQRNLELIEVDVATNDITVLLEESVENAFLERQSVRYVEEGGDMIWFSERTGWGHYYLYDHDGNLKNTITSGPYRAERVVAVDSIGGAMWFNAVGREAGENAYHQHLYHVNLDGTGLTLLDEGDIDHRTSLSPSRNYILDNMSRVDAVPSTVMRDRSGKVIMELETMDMRGLEELGFRPPETFMVKAADGVTDIYGNMWKPFDFDPEKKYPIIAHVYPGPQTESVTNRFSPTATQQQLAQLGFVVIQIGNRGGSPRRSNAYHSYGYYNLRDYGLADKKAGIEQLAARHEWVDIDNVGIYGHSGGGFMTAAALLLPPYNEFFKVGVSSAGNHDNNVYNQNWSEQHHGLREVAAENDERAVTDEGEGQDASFQGQEQEEQEKIRFEINVPTNQELAENLQGNLLLVHGDLDNNVHPAGTIRLVNALIEANKRFDMMIMPGAAHGFGRKQAYFNRMLQEYFAEHLLGDYYRDTAEIGGN